MLKGGATKKEEMKKFQSFRHAGGDKRPFSAVDL